MATSTSPLRVVIGAGGTGGHIYPGLATADALRALVPTAVITFSGTRRGLETTLVPAAGYALHTVPMTPLARTADTTLALFPIHLARSIEKAFVQLRHDDVDVVLGMGAYPSIPVVLASRLAGIPCIVHESNAVPGRANSLAARSVKNIATGFDPAGARWCRGERRDVRFVGIPLSESIASIDPVALKNQARTHFGVKPDQYFIVVSGGSQGAQSLNRAAIDLAIRWSSRDDVRLLIKARAGQAEEATAVLRAAGADHIAEVVNYIDRMDLAYIAADVAVTRSGSASIAELEHLGVPAVLVPYPTAPGDHQTHNAMSLVASGQAQLVADRDLTATSLELAVERALLSATRPVITRHGTAATTLAGWIIDLARARRLRRGQDLW